MRLKTLLAIILISIISCTNEKESIQITEAPVKINGTIDKYNGIVKTGQLVYFDAVTRIINNEIVLIDTLGNFSVDFLLTHPIIGSIFFELENNYYGDFYIEPNQNYDVTISGDRIIFNGETGLINREIAIFYDTLYSSLGSEIEKMSSSFNKDLSIQEYISQIKNFENTKLGFLHNCCKKYNLSEKVKTILTNEIRYKTAHSWMMYCYDNGTAIRDSLPPDFYFKLFTEYPILIQDDFENRNSIDYISNIVTALEKIDSDSEKRIQYISSVNFFTPEELAFISKLYSNNPSVRKTTEYKKFHKKFFTNRNMAKLSELFYQYNFLNVLNNLSLLNENIGRDLIITQAFSKNYVSKSISPTSSEWKKIDSLIINESIRNYIHSISVEETNIKSETLQKDNIVSTRIEEVKEKYFDKYLGKVIYVDFYATWCGPCIAEIPYSKELHYEFNASEVVFLNLCTKSSEENWKNLLKRKDIKGENYLLTDEEYILLSKLFEVSGFPTYAIVDKNGNIVTLNAPRPSSKKRVINEINKLL